LSAIVSADKTSHNREPNYCVVDISLFAVIDLVY